jgi:hypothetical protein
MSNRKRNGRGGAKMRLLSVLGIDPGPEESAAVEVIGREIKSKTNFTNEDFRALIAMIKPEIVYIEAIQNYGSAVGDSVFRTCYAIGRFIQVCQDLRQPYVLVKRPDIKRHLCGSVQTNDATVRASLLKRYGKGETNGITTHLWAALAVASYGADWEGIKN